MSNLIYRAYISLARAEHYTASEIGDVWEIGDSTAARLQLNWLEDENLKNQLTAKWPEMAEKFDRLRIFPKPNELENKIYSAVLRKLFGAPALRSLPDFTKNGEFILPKPRGFFVPKYKNKQVTELRFFNYGVLKI